MNEVRKGGYVPLTCSGLDSKINIKAKKKLLNSGIPCKIHLCNKCCIDTHMPVTGTDIKKITRQGYRHRDFVIRRKKDRYLKNINGKCFFLGDDVCKIYSFRPKGCQLYPLVYNERTSQAIIHDFCPYGHMFKINNEDVESLRSLVKVLDK